MSPRITIPIEIKPPVATGPLRLGLLKRTRQSSQRVTDYAVKHVPQVPGERAKDPWELRKLLLRWPDEKWLDFVSVEGPFNEPRLGRRMASIATSAEGFANYKEFISKALSASWRSQLTTAQMAELNETLKIELDIDSAAPRAFVITDSARRAIFASIVVDKLLDKKYRYCARPDCKESFEVTGKRTKFCQDYCAHITAVRRGRK